MSGMIVQSHLGVTLLGAGSARGRDVHAALTIAPVLVAADGGANRALALGLMPRAVIGDLDSVRADVLAAIAPDRLHRIGEQDSTDFDKCLRNITAPFVLALGFAAPQVDHTLAVFTVLARRPALRCLVLTESDVCFMAPRRLDLALPAGTRFSLFPMRPVRGRSRGLHWPIDGIDFAPDGRIGTSNRTDAARQSLQLDGDGMLVIVPRRHLRGVLSCLVPEWDGPAARPGPEAALSR